MPGADVKVPVLGNVPKPVMIGGGLAALVAGVYVYIKKKKTATATAGSASAYGYSAYGYGYPNSQLIPSAYGYGNNYGYGQYGYGGMGGSGSAGVGSPYPTYAYSPAHLVATNAEWAQAATAYLTGNGAYTAAQCSQALGAYILGMPVNASEEEVISAAIAYQGYPPQPGSNNHPPSINSVGTTGQTGTTPAGGTTPTSLPAPTGLHVSPSSTTAPASWNKVTGATGYVFIYWKISGGAAVTTHTAATSVNMSRLASKQAYYCYVYATNGALNGAHSPAVKFTTK
jgi:hypothetical protein